MSRESLEQFQAIFLQNPDLQEQLKCRLQEDTDKNSFISLAVELGKEQGHDFTAEDVEAAILERAISAYRQGPQFIY